MNRLMPIYLPSYFWFPFSLTIEIKPKGNDPKTI